MCASVSGKPGAVHQRYSDETMSDTELFDYLKQSYRLVLESLPQKRREALQAEG
jgi:predicted DNA-binding protein (MmcQ/YjbR family)